MRNIFPQITVSILNSNLVEIGSTIDILATTKIKYLHLDVMDGNFVPNLTFGSAVIKDIRRYLNEKGLKFVLDTHLMISNPQKMFKEYISAGSDIITFHIETLNKKEIVKTISEIKKNKKLVGLSIKPRTEVRKLIPYLKFLDIVLVMTVEPGFGGQKIIDKCISKIDFLRKFREEKKLRYIISADGGINEKNFAYIVKKGCDLPVVGSAIFKTKDIVGKVKFFQSLIKRI